MGTSPEGRFYTVSQRVSNGNFNYRDKNEGLLKVKVSYVRYGSDKCADVSETVKDCKAMVTIVR